MKTRRPDIRKARLADADALATCIDAAYAKYALRISDMPPVSDGIAKDIASNEVWVAVERAEVIAGLFLVPRVGFLKLANLAVHPEHGGRGIGRMLTELSESVARRLGYDEMRLNTHVAMPENIQFYEHLGWQEMSRSGNTVAMRKFLRGR